MWDEGVVRCVADARITPNAMRATGESEHRPGTAELQLGTVGELNFCRAGARRSQTCGADSDEAQFALSSTLLVAFRSRRRVRQFRGGRTHGPANQTPLDLPSKPVRRAGAARLRASARLAMGLAAAVSSHSKDV